MLRTSTFRRLGNSRVYGFKCMRLISSISSDPLIVQPCPSNGNVYPNKYICTLHIAKEGNEHIENSSRLALFMPKEPRIGKVRSMEDFHQVGVEAEILDVRSGPLDWTVNLRGLHRIRATGSTLDATYCRLAVEVEYLKDIPLSEDQLQYINSQNEQLYNILKEIRSLTNDQSMDQRIMALLRKPDFWSDPGRLTYLIASILLPDSSMGQQLIEELDINKRYSDIRECAAEYVILLDEKKSIFQKLREKAAPRMKGFELEKLTEVRQNIKDNMEKDNIDVIEFKLESLVSMPESIANDVKRNIKKLRNMDPNSSEGNVLLNHTTWITDLPWGIKSSDKFDPIESMAILDEDHYGMTSVKERIQEFVAVGALKGSISGKILCLAGPPGVGKVIYNLTCKFTNQLRPLLVRV